MKNDSELDFLYGFSLILIIIISWPIIFMFEVREDMYLITLSLLFASFWYKKPNKEQIKKKSSRCLLYILARGLGHMIILIILWASLYTAFNENHFIDFLLLSALGLFIVKRCNYNSQLMLILNRVGFISFGASIITSSQFIPTETIDEHYTIALILSNALFIPVCIAQCRQDLLESPYPQSPKWVQFCLFLSYPISIYSAIYILGHNFGR